MEKGKGAGSEGTHRPSQMKFYTAGFSLGAAKIPFFPLQPTAVAAKLNLSQQKLSLNRSNIGSLFSGWKCCATGEEERMKRTLTLVIDVRIQFKGK